MFSLVIPTFNERGNIKVLLDRVTSVLSGFDYEVLIVDDDSPDGTGIEVLNYRAINPKVRLLVRKKDKGLSSAVIAGFCHAKGDLLGVMDADLSHDESILPEMINSLSDFGLVVGSRSNVEGWGLKRKVISAGASLLAKSLLNVELSDPMSGFFVLKREVFEGVKEELNPLGFKILLEIYARARPSFSEVFYIFKDRVNGQSKLSSKVINDYLKQLVSLRSSLKQVKD